MTYSTSSFWRTELATFLKMFLNTCPLTQVITRPRIRESCCLMRCFSGLCERSTSPIVKPEGMEPDDRYRRQSAFQPSHDSGKRVITILLLRYGTKLSYNEVRMLLQLVPSKEETEGEGRECTRVSFAASRGYILAGARWISGL